MRNNYNIDDAKSFLDEEETPSSGEELTEQAGEAAEAEQATTEPSPSSTQAAQEQPPSWAEDFRNHLQAQAAYLESLRQQQLQQSQQSQQKPSYEREPSRLAYDTDLERLAYYMAALDQQVQAIQRQSQIAHLGLVESQRFQKAINTLRKTYSDFDTFIPESEVESALDQLRQNPLPYAQRNWEQHLRREYRDRAYEQKVKLADELEQKRKQKKLESSTMATKVPPSGAAFQKPTEPTKKKFGPDKQYKRATQLAAQEFFEG